MRILQLNHLLTPHAFNMCLYSFEGIEFRKFSNIFGFNRGLVYISFNEFSYIDKKINMTETQFGQIMDVLNQILITLEDIKRDMPGTTAFDLDDIHTEIGDVKRAVDEVTGAIRQNG